MEDLEAEGLSQALTAMDKQMWEEPLNGIDDDNEGDDASDAAGLRQRGGKAGGVTGVAERVLGYRRR